MNVKRLTILRDALIEHAKNPGNLEFNLNDWCHIPTKHLDAHPNIEFTTAVARAMRGENFCGTAACALGLATTIPAFRRAGLTDASCPTFGNDYGILAGETFFDIYYEDAAELFYAESYRREDRKNPLAVADKITALLHCA